MERSELGMLVRYRCPGGDYQQDAGGEKEQVSFHAGCHASLKFPTINDKIGVSMETIRSMLAGGDRRSLGSSGEVLQLVREDPSGLAAVMECLCDPDARVRMRAADVMEKISREQAPLLQRYKPALLELLAEATQ